MKIQSQLRRRMTSAPGHENGDTAATYDATFGAALTQPRNVPVFFRLGGGLGLTFGGLGAEFEEELVEVHGFAAGEGVEGLAALGEDGEFFD